MIATMRSNRVQTLDDAELGGICGGASKSQALHDAQEGAMLNFLKLCVESEDPAWASFYLGAAKGVTPK